MTNKEITELLLNFLQSILTSVAFWVGVALIIFIFIFKNEISDFLKRLKQFKTKGFEVNTENEDKMKEETPKNEELAKEEEKEEEKTPEAPKVDEPKSLEEWRMEMIFATFDKNQVRSDEAFKKMQELNSDPLSRKKDEILYLKFSHTAGKTDAIPRIRVFLTDMEVVYDANMALGFCYANSDDFENATKFYSQALEKASNEEEKSVVASQYSSSLYRNSKKDDAIKILVDVLSATTEDSNKVRLYESLADIYEKEKDHENRAFVLDKAVELKPNDTGLIFKVGYSYAESEYDELSLLHYKNAQAINPNDESVQNNLGVQYDNLKMPIKSVSSYRKAEKLGETLASANLAYRLMNAGFTEEATTILNSAMEKESVHPNVNSALSDLPKRIEKEDETEKGKIKSALDLRKFFLGFTEAKFVKSDKLSGISGEWKSEIGTIFQLSVSSNNLTATWKEKLISYEYDWKFEGEIFNNSSVLTIHEKEYSFSKSEDEYRKKGRGFLFCTNDGNTIKFIKIDDSYKSKKIYTLTRNSTG
ncbi:MAG: hypothetical protein US45_C0037G0011 [Candidatus Nomurabacteria bacterium GW2011_GWA1_37_20]|uniref:Uncharacterized protein n=1 Tax=Candidatus Nomurabacteria bacterium GW2011_GWA1_37_20 TaxID=1618729 RepID=A0A0G0GPF8_9BACT|nr:MAG: hypothetical protein US45_C0037G0011 [Candidatus Nomurabacteria bacterium GW2011_GWA1_37_20]